MGSITGTTPIRANDAYLTTSIFDLLSLKNRVVAITGGGRGIGLAMAFAITEAGGHVALVDAAPEPHEHYSLLQKKNDQSRVGFYQADVTDYTGLKTTYEDIVRDFGRIDGLVTAAGICPDEPFLKRSPENVKKCLEVNAIGTYYAVQLAVAQMTRQQPLPGSSSADAGTIVTIASIAAHQASKDQFTSDYCMSKGAVWALTKQLGVELARERVRINTLSPGYVRTALTEQLLKRRPALQVPFNEQPPMKRMGECTDLMAAIVYLLSDASAYMTGAEMLITGGMHAGQIV